MTERFYKQEIGQKGEEAALNDYLQRGYQLVQKNWRILQGEIDLIFKKKDLLVFVEVKTRTDSTYGEPIENIDYRKQLKLIQLVELYLARENISPKTKSIRLDAAEVFAEYGPPRLRITENILEL